MPVCKICWSVDWSSVNTRLCARFTRWENETWKYKNFRKKYRQCYKKYIHQLYGIITVDEVVIEITPVHTGIHTGMNHRMMPVLLSPSVVPRTINHLSYTGVFRIKHFACWKRFVLSQSNIENYSEPINSPLPHSY